MTGNLGARLGFVYLLTEEASPASSVGSRLLFLSLFSFLVGGGEASSEAKTSAYLLITLIISLGLVWCYLTYHAYIITDIPILTKRVAILDTNHMNIT